MTTIDLLRHGEAAPGLCLGGSYDAPLTETGWKQMRAILAGGQDAGHRPEKAGKWLPPWNGVVTSPLRRCAEFAGELARLHGLPLIQDARFRELGFGAWEGRSWSALYEEEGEKLLAFQRNPDDHPAPEGEDYPDFETRVAAAWADLLDTARDGHWLLVTHAGVVRAVLRGVLGFPIDRLFVLRAPHAGLTRIGQEAGYPPRLIFHGL